MANVDPGYIASASVRPRVELQRNDSHLFYSQIKAISNHVPTARGSTTTVSQHPAVSVSPLLIVL
jgi:hypothetical protein